ncbi:flagellar basal body rod modification protein [Paracoccus suum]|uniref:Basal-body rod modification protein FlgD n=1 Tax=Paracoccus suum TaxID=2259340 RepID=A0A344PII2_9RHOB|nr:flagellar hook capping FlgD N-terminal domain-containing protein [Paracoccus suum]AXC49187.1 flagellar basal body rod modification protein [Paracoccus suum]
MINSLAAQTLATAAVSPGVAAGGTETAPAKKSAFANGDFETFLKMLTTQIKNQDPLNPMEGSDFAVQLATFSGVEQQVRTNELLTGMNGGGSGIAGLTQYAGWIGKEVRSTAPVAYAGQTVTLEVTSDPAADDVVLISRDARGKIVTQDSIGAGNGPVDWLGMDAAGARLPNGTYTFEVANMKNGEVLSTTRVASYAAVEAAETGSEGVKLVLAGGIKVSADAVTAIREIALPASTVGAP